MGSERDSTPDTARAQTPYPSDCTGPPRSSPHTITHRQIECLSQADSTDKERREREERERERREERVRECAHVRSGRVSVVGCSPTTWLQPRAPQELKVAPGPVGILAYSVTVYVRGPK